MAHTTRRQHDIRPHPALFRKGETVGAKLPGGAIARGIITNVDGGGWIYVNWNGWPDSLPTYLRSTQVFRVEA